MKQINITLDTAIRLYEQGGVSREFALTVFDERQLTTKEMANSWYDLDSIRGYYIESCSEIEVISKLKPMPANRNVFATEKQAKSALAMSQLSQLMADCGDCDIDFTDLTQELHCISALSDGLHLLYWDGEYRFLTFKTLEIAEKFLELHNELIKQYFMM